MSDLNKIEKKVLFCLSHLSEKHQKVVLDVAMALAEEEGKQSGLSREQMAELDRRWKSYESGKSKLYTLEEVKQEAYKKIKKAKK